MKIKSPKYAVQAMVMVNQNEDDNPGAVGGLASMLSSFSLSSSSSANIDDEVYKLQSHTTFEDVVKRLGLYKQFWQKPGLFKRKIFYFKDSPFDIDIPLSILDTISLPTLFTIETMNNGKAFHITARQDGKTVADVVTRQLPKQVKTPLGSFRVTKTKEFRDGSDFTVKAIVSNPSQYAIDLVKKFDISSMSRKANAIWIGTEDAVIERAKEEINTIIDVYNERAVAVKQQQAANTSRFIEERLLKLYNELNTAETKIEEYKKENQIVDAEAEAEYIFKKKAELEGSVIELETRANVLSMVKDFLQSDNNRYSLIPFNSDLPEDPISLYNELVLERMKLETNAKGNNQVLQNISNRVDAMRSNLITSIDRELVSTRIALKDMAGEASNSESRMARIPRMEKDLTALYRDQIIKNQIYGYLLQKREESEVKSSRIMPVGMVIDSAYANLTPASPKPAVVYGGGVAAGLVIAFLVISSITGKKRKPEEVAAEEVVDIEIRKEED